MIGWKKAERTLLLLTLSLAPALPVVPVLLTPGVTQAPSTQHSARFGCGGACDSLNERRGKHRAALSFQTHPSSCAEEGRNMC